jgi:hypothetical protein
MKKISSSLGLLLLALVSDANGLSGDIFTGHLKLYVAVAVLAIILGCIFTFLFAIERRLKKLEQ